MFKITTEIDPTPLEVITTTNRGMNSEEWARLCVNQIIADASKFPEAIQSQVVQFRTNCERVVAAYLEMAYRTSYHKWGEDLKDEGFMSESAIVKGIKIRDLDISKLGYLDTSDWAELCVNQLIDISESAPDFIQEQANEFKDKCYWSVKRYMEKAVLSSSTTMYANLRLNHHYETADIIGDLKGKPLK
jgi:hypothetical protein